MPRKKLRSLYARHGWATRRLYNFERALNHLLHPPEQEMMVLDFYARMIWSQFGRSDRPCPTIRLTRERLSFCFGHGDIRLAPGERNILVLIHELIHARGVIYHNRRFFMWLRIIVPWYYHISVEEMILLAGLYGVK